MENLSNFEIYAKSDCVLRSSNFAKQFAGNMMKIRAILGVPSYALTCITGFLVLYSGGNKYPNRFIGAICLCQAISTYVLYQMDYDYCKDQIALKIFRNSLLTKDSELSKYVGFHLTTLSDLELAGIQIVMYTFWYHIA